MADKTPVKAVFSGSSVVGLAEFISTDTVPYANLPGMQVQVGTFTRNLTTASGNQSITGVGFQPKTIEIITTSTICPSSYGFSDGTNHRILALFNSVWALANTYFVLAGLNDSAYQIAAVASLDSDGFTLTWTKIGSPTGTVTFYYRVLR